MARTQWSYRDVSTLLQSLRNFLLGRKHTLHPRFPCAIAPRSIPPPDIPRGPEYKYSAQYYHHRNPFRAVYPPVVAPVAMGSKDGRVTPESVILPQHPTPGGPWWWDGHSYFECAPLPPAPMPDSRPPCPPMTAPPPAPGRNPCEPPPTPPCPQSPDKRPEH